VGLVIAERQPETDVNLSQVFHFSVYALAWLAGGTLTWAEGAPFPGGMLVAVAPAALLLNEHWRLVRVSGVWANLLGLIAFVYPTFEFFGENVEGRLLAGAHLLILLQCILLIQDKQSPQYWWVCTLSVLQMAVAAVLTNSGWFGVLMALYLLLAMWTVSVFSLYLADLQFREVDLYAEVHAGASPARPAEADLIAEGPGARPRPLQRAASMVRNSVQHDPSESWINLRFVAGVSGMTAASMGIGLLFFLLTPRIWLGGLSQFDDDDRGGGRPLSGFAERIQLGDLGEILESNVPVLQVRVFDNATNRPINVQDFASEFGFDEPLFRGSVLVTYDHGRWHRTETGQVQQNGRRLLIGEPRGTVRQEYQLEPIGTGILFAMRPYHTGVLEGTRQRSDIIENVSTGVLHTGNASRRRKQRYSIFSPRRPAPSGASSEILPGFTRLGEAMRRHYEQFPEVGLERVRALALELTRPEHLPPQSGKSFEWQMARTLEQHLRDSGQYQYSLNLGISDQNIDPLEDFLFVRKSGHCEYFASALVMLLRAVDIPARLISGFKGGLPNERGGYFEVQQRHAHAWVEAYFDGEWRVLDATPAADRQSLLEAAGDSVGWWASLSGWFTNFWNSYVLNLSRERQQEALYDPLRKGAAALWAGLADVRSLTARTFASLKDLASSPERWFSWQGGLTAFALLSALSASVAVAKWLRRVSRRWREARSSTRDAEIPRVEFYEEFLQLMARHGLLRDQGQTPREFAEQVARTLARPLGESGLGSLPATVVNAFYRVRFGAEPLSPTESDELRLLLERLQISLNHPA
jgi:transglutaminase-like putative cysteine protease